jgi:hypothetical protein
MSSRTRTIGENCALTKPPPDAGEWGDYAAFRRVYPPGGRASEVWLEDRWGKRVGSYTPAGK